MTNVKCEMTDCVNNTEGTCSADEILIDSGYECANYAEREEEGEAAE